MEEQQEEPNLVIMHHKEKKKGMHGGCYNSSEAVMMMKLASLAIRFSVRLRSSDMPLQMQEHALGYTRSLIIPPNNNNHDPSSNNPSHTHLARSLKKEFDSSYGPAWHCVIGKSFGSYVSHSGGGFFYFSIDSLSVLLFKTEVHLVTLPPPPHLLLS